MAKQNLGMVTAYAYAVIGGYEGTEAEFEALLGNIATDLEEIENLTVIANTLPAGSAATASYDHGVLTLGIPKGDKGDTGEGATATAGTTTTGAPGTNASVVNAGTAKDAVFNFTIPRGDTGNGIESINLTGTSGAVKTYTILFTDGNTTTFNVTDGEVTNDALTAILADYAKTDGAYESMTVGNAEQLISSIYVTDEEPYLFRTSGGSADIGDREFDTIVGGTVAWNQLVQYRENGTYGGVTMTTDANGIISFSGVAEGGFAIMQNYIQHISGHKYLYLFEVVANPNNITFDIGMGSGNPYIYNVSTTKQGIYQSTYNTRISLYNITGKNFTGVKLRVQIFDLTQLFSSATIADYIYSLEQATAGAGVAFFRKYFSKPYYPYDAGTIKSVEGVSAHKTVGFNAFDSSTATHGKRFAASGKAIADRTTGSISDYIRVVPNTVYYAKDVSGSGQGNTIVFYDLNKEWIGTVDIGDTTKESGTFTTPNGCGYIRFQYETVNEDTVCINLSWDGERNGEYEPYVKHEYPLDDITLRGIPKLSNGKLYYDGDVYESDGSVTRKYGIVDLGTLNWTYYTSGTNPIFQASISGMVANYGRNVIPNIQISRKYTVIPVNDRSYFVDNASNLDISVTYNNNVLLIRDDTYTNSSDFKTAMSGVYIVYELATPTTEQAEPFTNPQIVDDFGTEEYVANTIVPVGHDTRYTNNLKAKLEMSPESPSGDGDYIVKQTSGTNEYVPLGSTTTISNIIARLEALEGNE